MKIFLYNIPKNVDSELFVNILVLLMDSETVKEAADKLKTIKLGNILYTIKDIPEVIGMVKIELFTKDEYNKITKWLDCYCEE